MNHRKVLLFDSKLLPTIIQILCKSPSGKHTQMIASSIWEIMKIVFFCHGRTCESTVRAIKIEGFARSARGRRTHKKNIKNYINLIPKRWKIHAKSMLEEIMQKTSKNK